MMVTRNMEDFITWVDGSSRKRTIMKYNDEVSGDRFDGSMRDHAERLLKDEIAPLLVYLSWTISIFYRRSGWLPNAFSSVSYFSTRGTSTVCHVVRRINNNQVIPISRCSGHARPNRSARSTPLRSKRDRRTSMNRLIRSTSLVRF